MKTAQKVGIEKIISGGQTGADRAALDFAIEQGIPHGGWLPKGRLAEDGTLDSKYRLRETHSTDHSARTGKNVIDSDGTLILFYNELSGGSLLTLDLARKHDRPVLAIDLAGENLTFESVRQWIAENKVKVLNVAGPRASTCPKIYEGALDFLRHLFT